VPVSLRVPRRDLKNCTLITGFHGIGETGYIALSYLVHALKVERIGFVEVAYPPPFITATDKGIATPFEVYKKRNVVLVKLEFSPHRSEEAEFAKALASWTVDQKFSDAILIGGLDSNFQDERHRLRVVPTQAYLQRCGDFDAPTLEPELFVYGPLAVMLSEFEMRNFPAVAILPYASAMRPDPRAAAVAIKAISRVHRLKVDVSELEKDAKEIEVEIEKRMKQTKKSLQGMYG